MPLGFGRRDLTMEMRLQDMADRLNSYGRTGERNAPDHCEPHSYDSNDQTSPEPHGLASNLDHFNPFSSSLVACPASVSQMVQGKGIGSILTLATPKQCIVAELTIIRPMVSLAIRSVVHPVPQPGSETTTQCRSDMLKNGTECRRCLSMHGSGGTSRSLRTWITQCRPPALHIHGSLRLSCQSTTTATMNTHGTPVTCPHRIVIRSILRR
jgi:hypothetical protein